MKATRAFIRSLREQGWMRISQEQEAAILDGWGSEPLPHTYTEQDLIEQIRKFLMKTDRGAEVVDPHRPWERPAR